MAAWLNRSAHTLVGLAMVAMVWPAVPGWLVVPAVAPAAVWFLGRAATRRRPVDLHHAAMAAGMAAMPLLTGPCHGGTGPVAGTAAGYFLLAAAPFLTAPLRTGPRAPVLGPLTHGVMCLAMALLLTVHL